MTLKEFKQKHGDIVLNEVAWPDLAAMAYGASLFYVSLSNKTGPKEDKTILAAGHIMTTGMFNSDKQMGFVRITPYGNIKADGVTEEDLRPNGRAALFMTKPIPGADPRSTKPWNQWG